MRGEHRSGVSPARKALSSEHVRAKNRVETVAFYIIWPILYAGIYVFVCLIWAVMWTYWVLFDRTGRKSYERTVPVRMAGEGQEKRDDWRR